MGLINNIRLMPEELKELILLSSLEENEIGCSSSYVYKVKLLSSNLNAYLKICETSKESFEYEVNLIRWLNGKLPVPDVLYYSNKDGIEYFLMTEVTGLDASNKQVHSNPKELVSCLAKGLRTIHEVDISNCPFDQRLNVKLSNARYNIDNDLVDLEDIKSNDPSMTPEVIYKSLLDNMPESEDLVFTHGDYCLPNIIIDNRNVSGFIDWGRGGVADKYQDIGIAARTLKYNLDSEELIEFFFQEYGLKEVDREKVNYYILMDELF